MSVAMSDNTYVWVRGYDLGFANKPKIYPPDVDTQTERELFDEGYVDGANDKKNGAENQ